MPSLLMLHSYKNKRVVRCVLSNVAVSRWKLETWYLPWFPGYITVCLQFVWIHSVHNKMQRVKRSCDNAKTNIAFGKSAKKKGIQQKSNSNQPYGNWTFKIQYEKASTAFPLRRANGSSTIKCTKKGWVVIRTRPVIKRHVLLKTGQKEQQQKGTRTQNWFPNWPTLLHYNRNPGMGGDRMPQTLWINWFTVESSPDNLADFELSRYIGLFD